jgi:hypothetical protein
MRRTQLGIIVLLATVMSIGLYTAVANEISGTHAIVGSGEVTCLKCHYGKYEEMVATGHGQHFVEHFAELSNTEEQPETYACIFCHGKRDRWDSFGMGDWVVWYENDPDNLYPDEWWALGYENQIFPLGPGFEGDTTSEGGSSTANQGIEIYIETNSTGATISANITYFDVTGLQAVLSETVTLTEDGSNANYTGTIAADVLPDYFSVDLYTAAATVDVTLGQLILSGNGGSRNDIVTEFANEDKLQYSRSAGTGVDPSIITIDTDSTILRPLTDSHGFYGYGSYANNWNFHTNNYASITRMNAVWEDIRTIDEVEFPSRGIPISYAGTVNEGQSCSSTRFLCHATGEMINMGGSLQESLGPGSGRESYYSHSMTLSTSSEQVCGTCHAPYFAEGLNAHEGVQCYDCHASHPMPAGSE